MTRLSHLQKGSLAALALLFLSSGVMHFRATEIFTRIVPPYVPNPKAAVYISGVAEILGGTGLLVPRLRRWAAFGLAMLLVAVFPANVYMVDANIQVTDRPIPRPLLYARLPLQAVLIYLVLWCSKSRGFSPSAQTVSK